LPEFFILAYTDPDDAVFDPFLGSGTTLIAAAKNGRTAYGTEISPGYCDVIRRRWTRWALANNRDPGSGALDEVT
jgi:DNA modification methylase